MGTAVHDMEKVGQRLGTFRKISYFCPQKHWSHDSMRTYYNDVETDGSTRLNLVNLTFFEVENISVRSNACTRKGMDCFDYIPTSRRYQSLTE